MWTSTYSKVIKNVKKEAIWQRWSDVNSWHEWIPNIESCQLEKPFASGSRFTLKPKGSPAVTVELLNVKRDQTFTGCTRFFGATMYDIHEMHQDPQGIRLTVTLKVTGPLGFLWRKLVAEKIEANLPTLLRNLTAVVGAPELKNSTLLQKPTNVQRHPKPKLHLISSEPQKSKLKKSKSKKSTSKLKKTNSLLQSIPHESEISNRKVANSMSSATNLKLSSPAAKATPASKKPKAKIKVKVKPKSKTSAIKITKPKTKATAAKKTTVKAKPKSKTLAIKNSKPTSKSKTKAKATTSTAKKKTTKPKAKTTAVKKAAPKSKPKAKAIAKPKPKAK